jgi:predicted MFS family arabinose efflux permease
MYAMYDLENSIGILYPIGDYEGSIYQQIAETKEYIHQRDITSEGDWIFVTGPVFDREGNIAAMIETGYDLTSIQRQIQSTIAQTALVVLSCTIAFLLLMIEFILILKAYKVNKQVQAIKEIPALRPDVPRGIVFFFALILKAYKANKHALSAKELPDFQPDLPRGIIFFLFVSSNLAAAILPMYAANLYQPLFGLPREVVITLPFITDVIFAAIALLTIPNILERIGIRRIGFMAAILNAVGNILCFIAPNTLLLSIAYAFTGFAGGAMLLVINTVIGAQKDEKRINSGFAHFNASYLAGVNVGVLFGSILAQFFPYRLVFLFSSIVALLLLFITLFSIRSKAVNYLYDISYTKEEKGERFALFKFICRPVVLVSLLLLLLPYMVSMSFISYFMPIFGIENGLLESNIGQLILLSGLFAILFGTSLCEYVLKKFSVKAVITASLLLNLASVFLFSLNPSVNMLIAAVILMSIANIFVLTNIQTWYATLYQNVEVSSMKAQSVYSAVENVSMAIGPVVFSYILAGNMGLSLKLFAGALLAGLVVFLLVSGISSKRQAR